MPAQSSCLADGQRTYRDQEAEFPSGIPSGATCHSHLSLEHNGPSTAPQHRFMVVSWRVAAVSALDPSLASMVHHQSSRLDSDRAGAGTGRTGGHRGEAAVESVLSSLPFLALTRMPAYAVTFALCPP